LVERLQTLPGVAAGGFTNMAQPLEADDDEGTIVPPGWQVDRANPGDENRSERRDVTSAYLRALACDLSRDAGSTSVTSPEGRA
jgi:hypothetical protein